MKYFSKRWQLYMCEHTSAGKNVILHLSLKNTLKNNTDSLGGVKTD